MSPIPAFIVAICSPALLVFGCAALVGSLSTLGSPVEEAAWRVVLATAPTAGACAGAIISLAIYLALVQP